MNACQKIQIERLKLGSFNDFDGETVAKDLESNEDLWQAFVFGRFKYSQLIELRDLHEDHINADCIYVLVHKNKIDKFLELTDHWKPNEVGYYVNNNDNIETHGTISFRVHELDMTLGYQLEPDLVLVRLWWD